MGVNLFQYKTELASAMPSARSLDEVNTATKMRQFDQEKKIKKN